MPVYYFTDKEGAKGAIIELVAGTLAVFIGIYIWDKLTGPVQTYLGRYLGKWAGPVSALIISLVLIYIANEIGEGMLAKFIDVMAFGILGASIAKVFSLDPPYPAQATHESHVSPWETLEPVYLGG